MKMHFSSFCLTAAVLFSGCGAKTSDDRAPNQNSGDQSPSTEIKINETVKFAGETIPVAGMPTPYTEAYSQNFSLKLDGETHIYLENISQSTVCVTGITKTGPFITITRADGTTISNDIVAHSETAIKTKDFGSANGPLVVRVVLYASGHCYGVNKEFKFTTHAGL